jgi:putative sigma-54 modulation protein
MDLQIQGRNLDINDQVRRQVAQKLGQINRRLPGITRVAVELASEATRAQRDRIVAQVTVDVGGSVLRAEQRAANTGAALTAVADVLERRVAKYKSRAYRSERAKKGLPLGAQQAEEAQTTEPIGGEVLAEGDLVRVKEFEMAPMTVEEAAFQMQLLGHQFFMFLNSEADQFNVLYLRQDGNYGLIQPKIE